MEGRRLRVCDGGSPIETLARPTTDVNTAVVESLRLRLAETEAQLQRARAREAELSKKLFEMKRFVSVMEILQTYLKQRFLDQQHQLSLLVSQSPWIELDITNGRKETMKKNRSYIKESIGSKKGSRDRGFTLKHSVPPIAAACFLPFLEAESKSLTPILIFFPSSAGTFSSPSLSVLQAIP
ncbi:hypothetical protein Ccrd_005711 [Cynara cardunculus var. scolymus]|uniref:Uncharacterized protein n=1 Tax=Cynara cardunculus var. scolymus TaxID=59895 RepID=A0A103XK58_CYNCS|nr:hypothetical protein Ccrd_005711 [Cynara cardunculus var. scolymus]